MKKIIILLLLCSVFSCDQTNKTASSGTNETDTTASSDENATNPNKVQSAEEIAGADKASQVALADLKFKRVVLEMTALNYELKNFKNRPPEKTNMNLNINAANAGGKYNAALIDMTNVKKVEQAFIKGTKPMKAGGDTYPRANIEFWECVDEKTAKEKIKAIDALKKEIPWDVISKSPITYWQKENMLFFVTPGGMYMLDEIPKLRKFINEKI